MSCPSDYRPSVIKVPATDRPRYPSILSLWTLGMTPFPRLRLPFETPLPL